MSVSQRKDQLPSDVTPLVYRLHLNPNLETFEFSGEESVDLKINVNPNQITRIVANSKDLNIREAYLMIHHQRVNFKNIGFDIENDQIIFELNDSLEVIMNNMPRDDEKALEIITLHIKFTGELNDKLCGFYRSKYIRDGVEKYAAVTQFQPADARRSFVCWDDPAFKAIFEISLVAPKTHIALSNMHCMEETDIDDTRKLHKFAPTPPMSTYLVAYIVGEFDYVETISSETHHPVPIRIYTPVGKKDQGLFSLDVVAKVLPLFEKYFDMPYPLTKIDLIAVSQLSFGGMENYGLITFREQILLVDPVNTSALAKQTVAIVVAHELSHQWFGNLVTPKWWESLWLNEGYATYLEYFAIDCLYPEWRVFEQFIYSDFYRAFALDGLRNSHPVEVPVNSAAEIDEVFDAISYSKGSCCVRMLIEWLGIENFRKGMIQYLKKYKFSNASTNDLWNCLSEVLEVDVASVMSSWTLTTGYPIVSVTEGNVGGMDTRNLVLTQHRFVEDIGADINNPSIWSVPISYIICNSDDSTSEQKVLMREKEIVISVPANMKWIKFNKNQVGFFRVNFRNDQYYANLVLPIKNKQLSPIDRMSIIEDATSLSKCGIVPIEQVLSLFSAYSTEDNHTVLSSVASCLNTIGNLIKNENEHIQQKFNAFARSIFVHLRDELGWEPKPNEDHLTGMKRTLVMNTLLQYKDEKTIQQALSKFENFLNNPQSLIPDLRSVAYSAAVMHGRDSFQQVWRVYESSDLTEEKIRVLKSIGLTQDGELLQQTLNRVLDGSVPTQNISYMLMGLSQNAKACTLMWKYFFENYTAIREKFESGLLFGRIIKLFTENTIDENEVIQIKDNLEKIKTKAIQRTVDQVKESITLNSKWSASCKNDIIFWLSNNL
ncbi:hypothetical protein C9374_010556 [Naegleria lovaniensis]|uniref:Aminopeptidase n=1 Tax=Naegleria lovaniensis TaxID=51637 RepID=A0AA88KJD9_NAELO|nr:uncharacterized protein C9374_010556 [Naegleria lovaniensis]KAG2374812.1 hypothetical protein C9374_010556 [Naegleria lovaniensis]